MSPDEAVIFRPLAPEDDRSRFSSGNIELDRFFQRYAGQNQFRHHIGTTWIAIRGTQILGFATVSASHLELDALPESQRRRLPAYPLPVLRLARLAVDSGAQGLGIGRGLLRAVFILARRMSADFGCVGVVIDAKPGALAFYSKLGFSALATSRGTLGDRPEPTPMFLPIDTILVMDP